MDLRLLTTLFGIAAVVFGAISIYRRKAAFFDDGLEGFELEGRSAQRVGFAEVLIGVLLLSAVALDYLGVIDFSGLFKAVEAFLSF